jgi:hypothetical protein
MARVQLRAVVGNPPRTVGRTPARLRIFRKLFIIWQLETGPMVTNISDGRVLSTAAKCCFWAGDSEVATRRDA